MLNTANGIANLLYLPFRVDEVIYPAPWVVDEKFLNDNKIDFVAHDDIPYTTAGIDDAYAVCKKLGKFVVIIYKILSERQQNERKEFQHQT